MACNLKLLDYIREQNPGKVIPGNGFWSWGGGSMDKCGPFSTGQGTDPGSLTGDNPCIDVTGWDQMYYQFVYDTGKAFHYLVVNVKAKPNAGCDTKIEVCENDMAVNLKDQLGCSPGEGGTWYILNKDGISGAIDTANGTYAPTTGDGGSTLRMMYGFGGKQDGLCCGDTCQSAAILEIKVNACDCNDLHVILRRDKNELIADYSGCGNTIAPEYRWYKDQVLIEGETGNTINFVGYGDGDFLVKVICGDCEEQDRFFSGETCAYPEIIGIDIDDDSEPYEITVDLRHMDGTDTIQIMHRTNVTESGYDETEVLDWDLVVNDLTFEITPEYGRNEVLITLENTCGSITEVVTIFKDCPEMDPGLTTLFTMCEGCLNTAPALNFLDGTPDEGGQWEDVLLSGQLDDGNVHFDQLTVGLWEFRYTVNQDYASCTQSASLFVEVLENKSAGLSTSLNLCHDAGETDLLSLIPGNPDAGGTWYTDDVIDGTIDLETGKITPAATDIGKTITLAYSHSPQVSELPDGLPPAECWLEFDGVDDYVQARDATVFDVTTGDFDMEVEYRSTKVLTSVNNRFLDKRGTGAASEAASYQLSAWSSNNSFGNTGVTSTDGTTVGYAGSDLNTVPYPTDGQWHKVRLTWENATGKLRLYVDGALKQELTESGMIGKSITTSRIFTVGTSANLNGQFFEGDIKSFRFGTETFPMNEGTGTTITGSEGTILDINGATWNCAGVEECNCLSFSILTITIVDCTPPIPCPDDADLGVTITEETNASPDDPQWEDQLKINLTGSYEDPSVIDSDELYYSNDDGATWNLLTADSNDDYFVKDDDYYVKLTSAFTTTCNGGAQTGTHRMYNVVLSNGEDVQEGQIRSRLANFNADFTNIEPSDNLSASGASASLIGERYFRWDVRHILNSGWELTLTHTHFDRGSSGAACPSGTGSFGIHFYSGHRSGKRRILVERRITYNNGCDSITIQETFEPTLPTCPEVPSNVGFNIVPPYKIGQDEYSGSVSCKGSVPGSSSDTLYVFEQPTGSNGYASNVLGCGGSRALSFNYGYVFQRVIQFPNCPPIILQHNYNAPTSCPTATITCEKQDANGRARAFRQGAPFNLSSDYLQRRIGSGSWVNYTEGTWVNVSGNATVTFRRVANYNNGCPQTTHSCSVTVSPPSHSLTISCSTNTIIVNASNLPGTQVGFFLYRDGVLVGSNQGGNFTVSQNGNYQVRYKYNQVQYIYSNTINCGTGGGGCDEPTVNFGAPYVQGGNHIIVPFTTTNITSSGQLTPSIIPAPPGIMVFNANTGAGSLEVNPATPGQLYQFGITATNQCGSDSDSATFQMGCSSLEFDNVNCNYGDGQTTYDVLVSPDTGTVPTSNGTYLSKPSSGRYRFRINQTSGSITANHPQACASISQAINCDCPEPVVNLNLTCNNNSVFYSFTVTNESSVTSSHYYLSISGNNYAFPVTGAGTYSGTLPKSGLSHSYDFYYNACGSTPHITGSISCSCVHPSIAASATCDGTTVSYSFTVTNESQATSNYTILLNGSAVETKTRTGAGTYNGTLAVPAGSNNTVQVRVNSVCGGQRNSNIASANCACPPASLSISNVSCASNNQKITFDVNQSNITGLQIKVNGNTVTPGTNPYEVQGVPGQNTIVVTGLDSCAGTNLSDSVTLGCDCDLPSISLTGSCNTSGLVSFSFTVTNENRVNSTYKVIVNGTQVKTISKTSAGTYNSTWQGTPGNNYTLRIEAGNLCGSNTSSNTIGTNCACPSSSLAIANLACNPSNQMLTFNLNRSNVTGLSLKVNGLSIVPIPSNPISVQGQIGSNMIVATASDACNGNTMSDSKNINCLCNNNPTVSLGSPSESGGTITVPISTTNITSPGQITFIANGVQRSVTGSGNSYSVSFPAVSGNNSFSVTVSNSCGSDSDSGSYNYAPCVPPTITKIGQGTLLGGTFYVDFAVTNCDSISAPGTSNVMTCQTTRAQWNPGSSVLNWSITVNNSCGSDQISGTFDPCANCNPTITEQGCQSGVFQVDYLFVIDNSGSMDASKYNASKASADHTIDQINNSAVDARYAIVQYGPNAHLSVPFTSNPTVAKNYTRFYTSGADYLDVAFADIRTMISNNQLTTRPGAFKHIILFTDAIDAGDSRLTPFTNRNQLVAAGWNISVVKYPALIEPNFTIEKAAANATVGGSYVGSVFGNLGDPEGSATKPRRLYIRPSFDGAPIPNLVNDATTYECRLLAAVGCGGGSTYSWSASGGGSILSGQGTNTITTNGQGSYTVTIDTGNGCQVQKTYNY